MVHSNLLARTDRTSSRQSKEDEYRSILLDSMIKIMNNTQVTKYCRDTHIIVFEEENLRHIQSLLTAFLRWLRKPLNNTAPIQNGQFNSTLLLQPSGNRSRMETSRRRWRFQTSQSGCTNGPTVSSSRPSASSESMQSYLCFRTWFPKGSCTRRGERQESMFVSGPGAHSEESTLVTDSTFRTAAAT